MFQSVFRDNHPMIFLPRTLPRPQLSPNHTATFLQRILGRKREKIDADAEDLPRVDLTSDAFVHARDGRPPIQDEFADLPVSPSRKTRLRRKRDGRCVDCGGSRPCHRHSRPKPARASADPRPGATFMEWWRNRRA